MNGNFHLDLEDILPGLIWGVILIVWAVGKVMGAARGGRKDAPPPRPDQPVRKRAGADELREFLETLTGQKLGPEEEEPIEPEPRYAPPPVAMSQPVQATPQVRRPAAAPVVPVKKQAPEKRMSVFRPTQIRGADAALVGLQSMRLPGTSLPKAQTWASTQKLVPAGLREREDLRRAMVQRIVLGPPVALGGKASSPDLPQF